MPRGHRHDDQGTEDKVGKARTQKQLMVDVTEKTGIRKQ